MQTNTHVFLIGFMGAGKSYWGLRLAQAKDLPFLDLDELIVSREKKSIAQIFSESGESGFRELERSVLHNLANHAPAIVATGGGTPCFFDNMEWMNDHGTSIYLKTSPALLAARLQHEKRLRPLLSALRSQDLETFITEKVGSREPFYEQAQHLLEQADNDSGFLDRLLEIL